MLIGLARSEFERRLDDAVERFEQRCHTDNKADVREFLPIPQSDEDRRIGLELLCVDLQYRWRHGSPKLVTDYRREFPEWLATQDQIQELAFEEYRMTCATNTSSHDQSSSDVSPQSYAARYQIDTSHWPSTLVSAGSTVETSQVSWPPPCPTATSSIEDIVSAEWLEACDQFPGVGDCVDGFSLQEELGRGAFAVVFLARQSDLANRQVALKVSLGPSTEAAHLARLVHTHIMPIHSLHRKGPFRILCMPFLGRSTLESHLRLRADGPQDQRLPDAKTIDDYVRWIRDLATGLQFAHEQQIVHSDLKPANILLADNGRPMLMDFNLADDISQQNRAYVVAGGTLPYLSPEHLRRLQIGGRADEAADLYSLGVIFYQLLTGRLPFPVRRGSFDDLMERMIADRQQAALPASELNPAIPPSLAALLQKLLASRVTDRYASAGQLIIDLDRHLQHLPLKYATNPSVRERLSKFSHRHPALTSGTAIGILATVLLTLSLFSTSLLLAKLRRHHLVDRLHHAQRDLPLLRAEITDPLLDGADERQTWQRLETQLALCELNLLKVPIDDLLRDLPEADQAIWRDTMTQYLYLACLHWQREATRGAIHAEKLAALEKAEAWNRRAQEVVASSAHPMTDAATVVRWQAECFSDRNRRASFSQVPETCDLGESSHLRDPSARLLAALAWLSEQNYGQAVELLEPLRDATPHDPSVWLLLGNAYAGLERFEEAEVCYSICIPMWPHSYVGPFYRGLARLQQQHFQDAIDDLSWALQRSPQLASALMNRAAAYTELKDFVRAEADLTAAIALGTTQTRLYFLRADLRRRLHQIPEAEADEAEGLARTPTDELSWVHRALAKAKTDLEGAEADLNQALELNPNSRYALRNMAYIVGERKGDLVKADEYLERLILHHANPEDLISRAVYSARQSNREAAVADAQKALSKSRSSKLLFQAACVYSLLRDPKEPATQALAYLEDALAADPQWVRIAVSDPDLKNIRQEQAFQQIIQSAQQRLMRQNAMKQIE